MHTATLDLTVSPCLCRIQQAIFKYIIKGRIYIKGSSAGLKALTSLLHADGFVRVLGVGGQTLTEDTDRTQVSFNDPNFKNLLSSLIQIVCDIETHRIDALFNILPGSERTRLDTGNITHTCRDFVVWTYIFLCYFWFYSVVFVFKCYLLCFVVGLCLVIVPFFFVNKKIGLTKK